MVTRNEALAILTSKGQLHEIRTTQVPRPDGTSWPLRTFVNAPPTLRELYCEARSDKQFLVYEGLRLSFEDTWREACRLATALVELGVKREDRIALSMRNYPEWVVAYMAITSIGAMCVAMNALWQPDEMEYGLGHCGSKMLICDQERYDRLQLCKSVSPDLKIIVARATKPLPEGVLSYETLMKRPETSIMPGVRPLPDDDAIMYFTSGSTGHPKGAVSSHANVLNALMSWELDLYAAFVTGLVEKPPADAPQGVALLAIPLFHVTGSHAVFLQSFRLQRRLVSMYKWDVEKAGELIEAEQVTTFVGTPAITGDLVQEGKRSSRDFSSLRSVGGGGASRAPEQVRAIDATFPNAQPGTGWGMTETNAIGVGIAAGDYLRFPESSGRISAVLDMRVVGEDGKEVATGQRGELQVRGASIMKGYWNRPDANAESFVGEWFRTGDVVTVNDEGFVFIVDRIKDLVIRGGENIGCGAVEYALQEHPNVIEACVYGVPDERLGEEVAATIYVDRAVSEEELRAFLEPRLAKFQIPRYFTMSGEPLARGATGKILKKELRVEAARLLAKTKVGA